MNFIAAAMNIYCNNERNIQPAFETALKQQELCKIQDVDIKFVLLGSLGEFLGQLTPKFSLRNLAQDGRCASCKFVAARFRTVGVGFARGYALVC